jgi:rhomboid-like protein
MLARPQRHTHLSPDVLPRRRSNGLQAKQKHFLDSIRHFCTSVPFRFQRVSQLRQQIPHRAPSELSFRRTDLRPYEVKVVFGSNGPPPTLANTLLKVLHARRVNGTLDLDLPTNLRKQLKGYPGAVDDALAWLRHEHPVDEDAAILRRIEREEAGRGNEELIARAENLGLYKPQSGAYGAKLGDEGDIFGESELQKMRKENELKAEREQKELDEFIEQKHQAAEEREALEVNRALEAKKEDGLEGTYYRDLFRSSC